MKASFLLIFLSITLITFAQQLPLSEPLYPKGQIPNSIVSEDKLDKYNFPVIYPFVKEVNNQEDVVFLVIPGGGYVNVAINHEGFEIADRLNRSGFLAYVMFYRLPKDEFMNNKKEVPLQDAQRALAIIRERHPDKKVAVIGFSAGGHLAATLANSTSKIDFSILGYPVISMDDQITHKGSKLSLIGADPSEEDVMRFSMEKQVSKNTPPTFVMHAKDDKPVPIVNTERYVEALKNKNIAYETFFYEKGGHGFGLNNKQESGDWFEHMLIWIKSQKSD